MKMIKMTTTMTTTIIEVVIIIIIIVILEEIVVVIFMVEIDLTQIIKMMIQIIIMVIIIQGRHIVVDIRVRDEAIVDFKIKTNNKKTYWYCCLSFVLFIVN